MKIVKTFVSCNLRWNVTLYSVEIFYVCCHSDTGNSGTYIQLWTKFCNAFLQAKILVFDKCSYGKERANTFCFLSSSSYYFHSGIKCTLPQVLGHAWNVLSFMTMARIPLYIKQPYFRYNMLVHCRARLSVGFFSYLRVNCINTHLVWNLLQKLGELHAGRVGWVSHVPFWHILSQYVHMHLIVQSWLIFQKWNTHMALIPSFDLNNIKCQMHIVLFGLSWL